MVFLAGKHTRIVSTLSVIGRWSKSVKHILKVLRKLLYDTRDFVTDNISSHVSVHHTRARLEMNRVTWFAGYFSLHLPTWYLFIILINKSVMFFFSRETDNMFNRKLSTISSKARFFLPPNIIQTRIGKCINSYLNTMYTFVIVFYFLSDLLSGLETIQDRVKLLQKPDTTSHPFWRQWQRTCIRTLQRAVVHILRLSRT